MLIEPTCWTRKCKHYWGVWKPDGTEMTERHTCAAFPKRIPDEIVYGTNKHTKPHKDQKNNIIYEKAKPNEWPPSYEDHKRE